MKAFVGKRLAALAAALVLALSACTAQSPSVETSGAESAQAETTQAETTEAEAASTGPESTEAAQLRLGALKGPTGLCFLGLLKEAEAGNTGNGYHFTLAAGADELTPKLLSGELDIIAAPMNVGSILSAKSEGKVRMLAINTLGVLYIGTKGESLTDIRDLKGKTIYASGKGATPEYVLRYVLAQNGLDADKDITIEWKSEPTEVVTAAASAQTAVVMLPEPFMTVAGTQIESLERAFDLTQEWDKVSGGKQLLTAGLFVRADVIQNQPEAVAAFMEEYQASTEWVNANVEEAAKLAESYDIVKEAVAVKAIPNCNITYIAGKEMKELAAAYLDVLYTYNPQSVGGKVPDDAFYFIPQ